MVSTQDLGPVTAYAIAVKYGFSGTEQEWANAVDAQRQAASASATSAANSASEALTAANSAKASATSISSSVISANSSADSATASATSAANSLTAMQNTVAHMPVIGDNGNWKSWNGTAYADSGKPWKGEKGDTGPSFEYGESYDTLAALQAAYPSGDTKGHLVGTTPYVWDGTTWKESIPDLSGYLKSADAANTYVTQTRAINSKPLNSDITLTASDVGAVPLSQRGVANGISTLDSSGKIPKAQLPTTGGYVRQATAPSDTSLLWMDSANSDIMKYYNGTAWVPQPSVWG